MKQALKVWWTLVHEVRTIIQADILDSLGWKEASALAPYVVFELASRNKLLAPYVVFELASRNKFKDYLIFMQVFVA